MLDDISKTEFLSALWDHSPDPFWVCELRDGDFFMLAYNQALRRLAPSVKPGVALKELLGRSYDDALAPYLACVRERRVQIAMQHTIMRGKPAVFRFALVPRLDERGEVYQILATATELTESEAAKLKAQRIARELEALVAERTRALEQANAELYRANKELEAANARYQELALRDPLTALANRRAFSDAGRREFQRARRYGRALALVAFDMDDLKRLNDEFGHPVGDEAIRSVGAALSQACRSADLAARLGGDEFALILPETELAEAIAIAERCIHALAREAVGAHERLAVGIGLSGGVARLAEADASFESLYARADSALYRAKNSRKGSVVADPS